MSFPRYLSYKDSGVEWLGEVPEHWKTASLRWISKRYSGGTPDKLNLDYWTDGTIPWLNSGAVNEPIITEPSAYISEEALLKSSAKWVPKGALVMALAGQGKTKGMVAQLSFKTTCNQSMAAIIPTEEIDARFLYWWLVTNYQNIRNMAGGDLRDGLNLELLGNIPCPLLPYKEQKIIATFLDRETAKIDALIAEQQRLIELLKEKRQAVISHAVTKGLAPPSPCGRGAGGEGVPMKDSGIEWLGEVPAHWEVKRIKNLSAVISKGTTPTTVGAEFTSEGIRFLKAENIYNCKVTDQPEFYISEEAHSILARSALQEGDVLVVIAGATTGKAAVLLASSLPANTNQAVSFIRPKDKRLSNYINLWLNTNMVKSTVLLNSVQSTQPNLSMEDLGNLPLPLPPFSEIIGIESFLDQETTKLDALTAEAQRGIELLKERRAALISAAVTGKIDVRSALSPLENQPCP